MKSFFLLCLVLLGVTLNAAPTFPELTGRVVDQAGLLTPDQEKSLSDLSQTIEDKTTAQVVVVTLSSLEGYDSADYGYQLGRYWKIGQKGKDNGVLILLAPNEHKVRIEVGYGLEGEITDAQANELIQSQMLPHLKEHDAYGGINATMEAIKTVLSAESQPTITHEKQEKSDLFYIIAISVIPLLVIVFWAGIYHFFKFFLSIFMGGIVGLLVWIMSHWIIVSAVIGLIIAILTYFATNKKADFGTALDGMNFSGSLSSDSFDIFSGAGGSFGGGGASVDIGDLLDGLGGL
jgi:uncharacterized protein